MTTNNENKTTKELTLQLLSIKPKKYSEIMFELGKPDKTIYVTLRELQEKGLITKDEEGKYILTKEGRKHLKKLRLMQLFSEILDILLEEGQK